MCDFTYPQHHGPLQCRRRTGSIDLSDATLRSPDDRAEGKDMTENQAAEWLAEQIVAFDEGRLEQPQIDYLDQHIPGWHDLDVRVGYGLLPTQDQKREWGLPQVDDNLMADDTASARFFATAIADLDAGRMVEVRKLWMDKAFPGWSDSLTRKMLGGSTAA